MTIDADRLNEIREWAKEPLMLRGDEWQTAVRDLLAALDAAEQRADCGGVNCGKCQQCLQVHEFFALRAVDALKEKIEAAEQRAVQAEQRVSELEAERG